MKKIGLICLIIMITVFLDVFAAPIHSYQELTAAVSEGNRFVILVDLQQCTGIPGMPKCYLAPTVMLLIPASETTLERVATSILHFTDHLGYPTYEYIKYTFYSDNTVAIRTASYDPQSFQPIGVVRTINCLMGQGVELILHPEVY